jgi:hypothetical protein
MNIEKVRQLPKDVKGHWDEVRRSALDCFNFWKVLQKLPELVEMENGMVKGIGMWVELNWARMHCEKARKKVRTEIKRGLQVCSKYMREAPHPHVLISCAIFARCLQLCCEEGVCESAEECAVLKFAGGVDLEV